MDRQELSKQIAQFANRSYWVGFAWGLLFGIIVGATLGIAFTRDVTVFVPLQQGTKV